MDIQALVDLVYKLTQEYGITIFYFSLYVASVTYFMVLRSRENKEMLKATNELTAAFNSLQEAIQHNTRQNALIMVAAISAVNGNVESAKNMIAKLNGGAEEGDES